MKEKSAFEAYFEALGGAMWGTLWVLLLMCGGVLFEIAISPHPRWNLALPICLLVYFAWFATLNAMLFYFSRKEK